MVADARILNPHVLLDPPVWKAGDHVQAIDGRIYPLSDEAQPIAHAGS